LILNRISGLIEMRMTVDETGRVKGCVPQMTVWVPQFGSDACHQMERWARFEPARDDHGNPVSAMYRTAAMYVIYNW
jgi:protein TonB